MTLRTLQILAVLFMAFVAFRHYGQGAANNVFAIYWREILFAIVGVAAAWLFFVTHALRPVVAIFAAAAFYMIASLDAPSAASFLAALDGISARVLGGVDAFRQG